MENGKKMDMQAQTAPDAPKKNAAPAEAPKSLGATIQNVISKAVTSPTDGKIDFAQGVNHITGDPHQKSAKPAETMQSLKAMNDPEMKKETEDKEMKEAEDKEDIKAMADKEKMMKAQADIKKMNAEKEKDMKEADMKKMEMMKAEVEKMKKELADKEKMLKAEKEKEMNEGEMPKAALDALKKSQEKKDAKEEDEKKDIKAMAMKDKKDVKEEDEKEKKDIKAMAMKDKKEEDEKKEIKASAKDKVKDMDMKEDVAALTDGEELSEEFKAKAATIFESAVKAKLVEEIEKLEGEYEAKVADKVEETKEEIVEKVDAYLNYVVEEWMKENELAIEKGLRAEITEDFIGGLKSLFESHYINVPQEKYDVIESQAAEIEKLKEEVNQTIEKNVELNQKVSENNRQEIINDVSSDLAATEAEKLGKLAESIEYKDAESFRNSVETLKNSYYPKQEASDNESNEVAANAGSELSESMAAYTAAISKSKKNPYQK